MFRVLRLLQHGILPLLVFDGDQRPENKQRSTGRKSQQGNAGDSLRLLKRLLDALHVPRHQAPGEAEAECAALQSLGVVDAVWTEDGDALMFGCSVVVRKTKEGPEVVEVFRMDSLRERGFTCKEAVVLFAMLVGCDYTSGLAGCGSAMARKVLLDESVRTGDLLEQFWGVETHGARSSWLRRLRDVLPASLKDAVNDDKFASLTALRNCRRPIVSGAQTLERLRGVAYREHTSADLHMIIPFLQDHFNRNYALTWPLKQLAPVQLVWSLLKGEPGARGLVAAFKQKNNKARLTSPVQVDPICAFPGIDDSSIGTALIGMDPIVIVECEILDAILAYGMSEEEFRQWREGNTKAWAKKTRAREALLPNGEAAKAMIPSGSSKRITDAPSPVVAKAVGRGRKRKADDQSAPVPLPFQPLWESCNDKFWELDASSQEYGRHRVKRSTAVGTGNGADDPIGLD
ncbi:hypothetical protein CPLU01_03193 [Colletotrichum plurivorum]|uniref:XPG-I domain-containing protein n=1 Tax=Colletotrichum plurivorum TaxID=2175906 RepID=A0A8H6KTD6_9PEZI|nr:hypothetical protein CPLU01_03193 [Colletotrichum plurivorum]